MNKNEVREALELTLSEEEITDKSVDDLLENLDYLISAYKIKELLGEDDVG